MTEGRADAFRRTLDAAAQEIEDGPADGWASWLLGELNEFCCRDATDWPALYRTIARAHPLWRFTTSDPYTRHSLAKPRGYPGDAELLDYLYGLHSVGEDTPAFGRRLHAQFMDSPGSRAIRGRLAYARALALETLGLKPPGDVLCVGCGHLRELMNMGPGTLGSGRFIALDQDAEAIRVAGSLPEAHQVELVTAPITALVRSATSFGTFRLIYGLGVLDYVADLGAISLIRALLRRLTAGGKLSLANFTPATLERGYMEVFMEWVLIYRTEVELLNLVRAAAKPVGDFSLTSWTDPTASIAYCEATARF